MKAGWNRAPSGVVEFAGLWVVWSEAEIKKEENMFEIGDLVVLKDKDKGNFRDEFGGDMRVVARTPENKGWNVCSPLDAPGTTGIFHDRELALVRGRCIPAGPVLSTDSTERKATPVYSGVLNYFPLAVAAVARVSKAGNDKHNPGEPLGWARAKSGDHADCIARHLIDHETLTDGEYRDAAEMAWRALALLQELEERRLGAAPSRGSR